MEEKNERELVAASVTFDPDLLAKMDARARELDLNRSQYLRRLAREDLEREGKMTEKNQLALGLGRAA